MIAIEYGDVSTAKTALQVNRSALTLGPPARAMLCISLSTPPPCALNQVEG